MTNVATEYTTKELMAAFVASDIEDVEIVSVGASLPVAAPAFCWRISLTRPISKCRWRSP